MCAELTAAAGALTIAAAFALVIVAAWLLWPGGK